MSPGGAGGPFNAYSKILIEKGVILLTGSNGCRWQLLVLYLGHLKLRWGDTSLPEVMLVGGLQVWDKGASPTPLSEPFPYLGASCCSAWSSQLCLHVCGVIMTEKDAYDPQVQSTAHPPMPIEHIPQCHVSMVLDPLQAWCLHLPGSLSQCMTTV